MIGDAERDGRRGPQSFMHAAKIVVRDIKRDGGHMVL
jgi:hypothetical protein